MHSNRDLFTTTPLVLHHGRDGAGGPAGDAFDGAGPEHGEGTLGRCAADPIADPLADTLNDDLEELEPGPSDVNGG